MWLCHPFLKIKENSIVHWRSGSSIYNISFSIERNSFLLPIWISLGIFSKPFHFLILFYQFSRPMNSIILINFFLINFLFFTKSSTTFSKPVLWQIINAWLHICFLVFLGWHRKYPFKFVIFTFLSLLLYLHLLLLRDTFLQLLLKHFCQKFSLLCWNWWTNSFFLNCLLLDSIRIQLKILIKQNTLPFHLTFHSLLFLRINLLLLLLLLFLFVFLLFLVFLVLLLLPILLILLPLATLTLCPLFHILFYSRGHQLFYQSF